MRRLAGVASAVLLCVGLAGCVPPGIACTAVGYSSVARVVLAEPRPGVQLELCDGEACVPGPAVVPEDAPLVIATELPAVDPASPAADPTAPVAQDTGILMITGDGITGWSADFLGGQPVVGYRVTSVTGELIAEGSTEVDWVRVGGTAQCGGPREATIELPA